MKIPSLACAIALAASAAGCNSVTTGITTANNALANLAKNDIPAACGIIGVAEGYFANVKSLVPAKAVSAEATAARAVAVICNHPPSDIGSAFATLMAQWTTIQAATTAP